MKKSILILLSIIVFGCNKISKDHYTEGIYCLKGYIDKDNFESNYIESFLVKVTKDKIIRYGTVNTWGSVYNRNLTEEKKSKINDSIISFSTIINGESKTEKFIKLKNADKIVDEKGINREEFVKFLNENLIAGNYKLENKIVKFSSNGKIENLDSLNTFSINPRFGTCWWYDYRTIEINNQLWKFDFTKKHFILTKYLKRNEVNETKAELSNTKIILNR